jgi:hypothetical protein
VDASAEDAAAAQKHKPLMINRLYTGPDGQTHVEEIEAKFVSGGEVDGCKLLANAGAELRRAPPQRPRRTGPTPSVTDTWRHGRYRAISLPAPPSGLDFPLPGVNRPWAAVQHRG